MTETFEQHRGLLFSAAYQILGSVAEAEDAVQDSWLRWNALLDQSVVETPRAYLLQVVSRTALNRLRSAKRRREDYIGPWLPEPVQTAPDVAEEVERADAVSMAMLVVLESLSPAERAVFVLREVFDMPYEDIATIVDKSPAAVRQLAHRSREHTRARQPRFDIDKNEHRLVTERFLAACAGGDTVGLFDLLAPQVVILSDGGGKVTAARRPVVGADKASRLMIALAANYPEVVFEFSAINGQVALVAGLGGDLPVAIQLDVRDGLIAQIFVFLNPDKLSGLYAEHDLFARSPATPPSTSS